MQMLRIFESIDPSDAPFFSASNRGPRLGERDRAVATTVSNGIRRLSFIVAQLAWHKKLRFLFHSTAISYSALHRAR